MQTFRSFMQKLPIIELFGLSNRTSLLIELFRNQKLRASDIDFQTISNNYQTENFVGKISFVNSKTVIRDQFVYLEKLNIVVRHSFPKSETVWELNYDNPLVHQLAPLFRSKENKPNFLDGLNSFMEGCQQLGKSNFKSKDFIAWCRKNSMSISPARASQILRDGLEAERDSGLLLQRDKPQGHYRIIQPQ